MNAKKSKRLRREIFGDVSFRHPSKYLPRGRTIILVGPWKAYRKAKRQGGEE